MFEEAAIRAIRFAYHEACKLIPPQLELARLTGRRKARFSLAGADPAAAERVLEKGKARVAAILQDTWQAVGQRNARLADAKAGLQEELKSSGFFRIDVRPSLSVSPLFTTSSSIDLLDMRCAQMSFSPTAQALAKAGVAHRILSGPVTTDTMGKAHSREPYAARLHAPLRC